jgi:uncharacterized protein with PQ loop repeat
MLIIGIIASVLLALGLIPPYFELAKRQGRVVGINFIFLGMDCTGALFSMLSILVGTMDIMSIVLYAIVMALEIGIFLSHAIWWLRIGRKGDTDSIEIEKQTETSSKEDVKKDDISV